MYVIMAYERGLRGSPLYHHFVQEAIDAMFLRSEQFSREGQRFAAVEGLAGVPPVSEDFFAELMVRMK